MLDWLLILAGVIITQFLVLNIKYFSSARGYMFRAAQWIWSFLLIAFLVELVLAAALFYLGAKLIPFPRPHWALLVGVLAVLLPTTFEYLVLFRNASEKKVGNPLVKILQKLNLDIVYKFAWAIRTRMEQDSFDCQTDGWGLGLTRDEIGRKIRVLYALHMREIATERGDFTLIVYDVGVTPWEKFYLLAEHLGRKRLREQLASSLPAPEPLEDWDGRERRRNLGTKADRSIQNPNDRTAAFSRCSDDLNLQMRISKGSHQRMLPN